LRVVHVCPEPRRDPLSNWPNVLSADRIGS
jgi:hypothetical protein